MPCAGYRTAVVEHIFVALYDDVGLNVGMQRTFDQIALSGERDAVIVRSFGLGLAVSIYNYARHARNVTPNSYSKPRN